MIDLPTQTMPEYIGGVPCSPPKRKRKAKATVATETKSELPLAKPQVLFKCEFQVMPIADVKEENAKLKTSTEATAEKESVSKMAGTTTMVHPLQTHNGQQQIMLTGSVEQQMNGGGTEENMAMQSNLQSVYPTPVQYLCNNETNAVYTNGQMLNYGNYDHNTMYAVSGAYYQPESQTLTNMMPVAAPMPTVQGHIIQQQGPSSYIVQEAPHREEQSVTSTSIRAPPSVVFWLKDNFERVEGFSLPRCIIYQEYMNHCNREGLPIVNAASFGKMIRNVLPGLSTRRLGTRGNSKYYYYGIQVKKTSKLTLNYDDISPNPSPNDNRRDRLANGQPGASPGQEDSGSNGDGSCTSQSSQDRCAAKMASVALPPFGNVEVQGVPLPQGVTLDHVRTFESLYRELAVAIINKVVNLQFDPIEILWKNFWRAPCSEAKTEMTLTEVRLPKAALLLLCAYQPLVQFVKHADYLLFQTLVHILVPDVLKPIASSLTQSIRMVCKSLDGWMKSALQDMPQDLVTVKMGAISALAQTLRRYTSLNHLAQAARAVLHNPSQLQQMLADINRLDFTNLQDQACWVSQCEDQLVQQIEKDFKQALEKEQSLEQWAVWLEGIVDLVLKPHQTSPNFPDAARHFLLKWSFYTSMVIRDLTLRSASSFGSYHLIRLLFDEFLFYLVEHKVAAATGLTTIAVMAQVSQFSDLVPMMAMSTQEASQPASANPTLLPKPHTSYPSSTITSLPLPPHTASKPSTTHPTTQTLSLLSPVVSKPSVTNPTTYIQSLPYSSSSVPKPSASHSITTTHSLLPSSLITSKSSTSHPTSTTHTLLPSSPPKPSASHPNATTHGPPLSAGVSSGVPSVMLVTATSSPNRSNTTTITLRPAHNAINTLAPMLQSATNSTSTATPSVPYAFANLPYPLLANNIATLASAIPSTTNPIATALSTIPSTANTISLRSDTASSVAPNTSGISTLAAIAPVANANKTSVSTDSVTRTSASTVPSATNRMVLLSQGAATPAQCVVNGAGTAARIASVPVSSPSTLTYLMPVQALSEDAYPCAKRQKIQ